MSDLWIVAGIPVLFLLMLAIAIPLGYRNAQRAREESNAAWLANVDKWNKTAADGCPDDVR